MIQRLAIHRLMQLSGIPVADVRTPAEFARGHVPGAFNLPLFTNEERARVGTTYKQTGREAATLLGFELTGPKWAGFIRQALEIAPERRIALHCWRGGMRSGAMAWALDLYGFEVILLEGGYKSYRNRVLRKFEEPIDLFVVGGMTGSGKTDLLHQLQALGEQVIDLEGLAQHQGSVYGSLNRLVQPTQEQFENELAARLDQLCPGRKIWIEDESMAIGRCMIPDSLWRQMQSAVLFDLDVPVDRRVRALVAEYGSLDKEFLIDCTERIRRRLGGLRAKQIVAAIREGQMEEFIRLALEYYDKAYRKCMNSRPQDNIIRVDLQSGDIAAAGRLLEMSKYGTFQDKTDTILAWRRLRL
jgi:tRNA 2-selenouridine synthase